MGGGKIMAERQKSYGKEFERQVFKNLSQVEDVSIDRIPDQVTRYKGSSSNICDFLAYKKPTLLYLECKTVHGNTLPFSNIRDNQWQGLLNKSHIPGVKAGVIIWFIDHDITIYAPISLLEYMRQCGEKSIKHNFLGYSWFSDEYNAREIPGVKKRTMFEYDFSNFFEEI